MFWLANSCERKKGEPEWVNLYYRFYNLIDLYLKNIQMSQKIDLYYHLLMHNNVSIRK